MDKNMRRCQNILMTAGNGTILLALWSVIKMPVTMILDPTILRTALGDTQATMLFYVVLVFLLVFVLGIPLCFYLYVGFAARHEACGKRKKNGRLRTAYIIIDAFLMIFSFISAAYYIYIISTSSTGLGTGIASCLVEITAFVVEMELFVSAIRFRRMLKENNRKEA